MSELRDAMLNHYSHNNNNNNDDNELAHYVLAHYWYSVQLICSTVRKSSDAQRRERARAKYPPPAAGEGTPPERPACGRRGHAVMR